MLVLVLAGCAHRRVEPARARLLELAAALDRGDAGPGEGTAETRSARARTLRPELTALAARIRLAAEGRLSEHTQVKISGPLGSEIRLDRDPDGWRVDPDSAGLPTSSPRAAIEQLVVALDRLESDPALALLSRSLYEDVIHSSRERAEGLRELLPRVSAEPGGQLPVHLEYGSGLFVLLKPEHGEWRVDDFN